MNVSRVSRVFLFIALAIAILGVFTLLAWLSVRTSRSLADQVIEIFDQPLARSSFRASREALDMITDLDSRIEDLQAELDSISNLPQTDSTALALGRVNGRINNLSNRIAAFERVIAESPLEALETTLLRRDLESSRDSNDLNFAFTRQELDRLYTQNNVFIGLIGTTLLALIGFIVSIIANRPKTHE